MDQTEYRALVAATEADFASDPVAVRRRVARFVALGHAYVLVIVGTIALALVLVLVTAARGTNSAVLLKLAVALGALLVVILRSLDIRFDAPTGIPVTPVDAPRFHERLDEIRRAVDAPAPDEILLNDDFNAAVTQVPESGLAGQPRTYLIIGVPLLYALTPGQFDAVLAHEFGHLSGSHPKHGLRVWRMARVWQQLMTHLAEKRSWGAVFFENFFRWYVPRLYAYGFAMARRDEREADADAARIAGREAIGSALVALSVRGRYLQEAFWPEVWARSSDQPEPVSAWRTMPHGFRESDRLPRRRDWIDSALLASADDNDTHPSLQDRLIYLGLIPQEAEAQLPVVERLLVPLESSAAEHYLPELARIRLDAMEHEWQAAAAKQWGERFTAASAMRARLEELHRRDHEHNNLSTDELWEVAAITADLLGEDAALSATQRFLAERDDHAAAHFLVGRALFARGDSAGEQHLARALELDPDATPQVAPLLMSLYDAQADDTAKAQLVKRYEAWVEVTNATRAERTQVNLGDKFHAPSLNADEISAVRAAMVSVGGIRSVLVGRKVMQHRSDRPLFVMLLRRGWLRSLPMECVARFAEALQFQHEVLLFADSGEMAWLKDALEDGDAFVVNRETALDHFRPIGEARP
jgi:Zn-dependent protease with chaperone function